MTPDSNTRYSSIAFAHAPYRYRRYRNDQLKLPSNPTASSDFDRVLVAPIGKWRHEHNSPARPCVGCSIANENVEGVQYLLQEGNCALRFDEVKPTTRIHL